jgi:hypothetical protein
MNLYQKAGAVAGLILALNQPAYANGVQEVTVPINENGLEQIVDVQDIERQVIPESAQMSLLLLGAIAMTFSHVYLRDRKK